MHTVYGNEEIDYRIKNIVLPMEIRPDGIK